MARARPKSRLIMSASLRNVPTTVISPMMQAKSMNQARQRVTGQANGRENAMPSGVRMTRVLTREEIMEGFPAQEGEQRQFDQPEYNFEGIGNDWFMVLGKKTFDQSGPDQQNSHAKNQGH